MNNKRRAILKKAIDTLEIASNYINNVLDEEQDSLDNMPENLGSSEKYSKMEAAIEKLEDAIEQIDDAKDCIEEASE